MIDRRQSGQQPRSYTSYEEYLNHFYGASGKEDRSKLNLEASFGERLAKRVLEIEATESRREKNPEST
jgi:hypothetical protein